MCEHLGLEGILEVVAIIKTNELSSKRGVGKT
jgi:hypothetical protein